MKRGAISKTIVFALVIAAAGAGSTPLRAQTPKNAKAGAASDASVLVGAWMGTASVPIGDSTIVVPVTYTFTKSASGIGGMAFVPGQGQGQIANVVRDGAQVRFRVTVTVSDTARVLEHEGTLASNGAIEGMVNLNKKPVAKFRITPTKPSK